ncbi:MAG: GGDEF domain-containing protein [Burkholderiales bacterium]|nr:GGDEF domain-containing protein [Burkholderiales bacterium]
MTLKDLSLESRPDAPCGALTDLHKACEGDGAPGINAAIATQAQPGISDVLSADAIGDWSNQFSAVTTRLRLMVDGRCTARQDASTNAEEKGFQAGMLQCVAALDHLHLSMMHDLERRRITWPSRSIFLERMARTLAEPEAPHRALLYIDLDDFDAINRGHGQDVGNELLRVVALRLALAVRAEDVVARLQGDEFACLLRDLPRREQLSDLACKLFLELSTPLDLGDLRLSVHPSLGIALWPADGATVEALLRNADAARERAKRQATGYAFFNESADVSASAPVDLSSQHPAHFGELDA